MLKSLKSKISLILIVFLILTIGNSMVSIKNFNKLQNSIDLIMKANYDSVVASQTMIESIERQDSLELNFVFEDEKNFTSEYKENHKKFLESFYRAKSNITEAGEGKIIVEIEDKYSLYAECVSNFERLKETESKENVSSYYYNNLLPLFNEIKSACFDLTDINQQAMVEKKEDSRNLADSASKYILLLTAGILLIGFIIIGYLLKKIIKPVEDITRGINKVTKGDYNYTIPLGKDKESNFLLEEFNNMVKMLREYEELNVNEIFVEKQKAEGIIESIDSPIIVTDEENKITMINKATERLLDIKEKSVINRHFLEGIDSKQIFSIIQEGRKSIKEYQCEDDIELEVSGIKKIYRVTTNPIWFQNETNIGSVTTMHDITKFKEVEKLKSEFISTVSHEFRTPLTSITMAVGLLLENDYSSKEDEIELLKIIEDDSERLNRLVEELLDLSKMQSGKILMNFNEYNISDIINQVVKAFKMQLEEKKVTISVDTASIQRKIKADFEKITWVIINLVGNALRYVKDNGTGRIEIAAKQVNSYMLISVNDNGEGIDDEYQKVIFEKFVQLKDQEGEITGSSGLGLAISKEIVKAHSGDIWVDSTLGEGSTFYFTLKLGGEIDEKDINC